jgi:hypothetical protein
VKLAVAALLGLVALAPFCACSSRGAAGSGGSGASAPGPDASAGSGGEGPGDATPPNPDAGEGGDAGAGTGCGPIAPGTNVDIGANVLMAAGDPLRQDVSQAAIDPQSAAIIAALGATNPAGHPSFGSLPTSGYPYVVVPSSQPKVPITATLYTVQAPPFYPIPPDAPVELGSDAHVYVLQCDPSSPTHLGTLYELFAASFDADAGTGGWSAASGAYFDVRPTEPGPTAWTFGTDAAGIPKLPLLVRYEEIAAGVIEHALSFTTWTSSPGYVYPAIAWATANPTPNAPPMGARLRLHADFDVSGFSKTNQIILQALKTYGMILTDNADPTDQELYLEGVGDARFDDGDLHALKTNLHVGDFDVLTLGTVKM